MSAVTPLISFGPSFGDGPREQLAQALLRRLAPSIDAERRVLLAQPDPREMVLVVATAAVLALLADMDIPVPETAIAVTVARWDRFGAALRRHKPDFAEAIEARRAACNADQIVLVVLVGPVEMVARLDTLEVDTIPTKGGDA